MLQYKVKKEDFLRAYASSSTVTELVRQLDAPSLIRGEKVLGEAYAFVKRSCLELGLDYYKICQRKDRVKIDTQQLEAAVDQSRSIRQVCDLIGISYSGSSFKKVKNLIRENGIDCSHLQGQSWSKNCTEVTTDSIAPKRSINIFAYGTKVNNEMLLKSLVLDHGVKYQCDICGINSWNKKPLRLRLDHIDGDSINNCMENLRLICSNCDSQTDTFCRGQRERIDKRHWWEDVVEYGSSLTGRSEMDGTCVECGAASWPKAFRCKKCYDDWQSGQERPHRRKVQRPTKEALSEMLWEKPTTQIAKQLGVSDKAINKWCDQYGIEKPGRGHWAKLRSKN